MDVAPLVERLRHEAAGEVRADLATREMYACDASLYRRLPAAALRAAAVDDLDAGVAACREHGVPLTMRGAGTSLAGQTVGRGLVVDCSSLDRISIDPEARTATVGPGAVLDRLNAAAGAHGLVFGPDVATGSRATLGGMIANNSAGARSVVHGLTADHVLSLDVVLADGTRATLARGRPAPPALEAARGLGEEARFPSLLRRVSGYALDALAGDDPDWPGAVAGSEGTLAVIRSATLRLVPLPTARGLALLPYPTVDAALEAVVGLLETGPSAIELMDGQLLDPANRAPAERELVGFASTTGAAALLVVEHSGEPGEVADRLGRLDHARVILDDAGQAAVWAVRRAGIARALGAGGEAKPVAFIEDPAVPPERLAPFARALRGLLAEEGVPAVWYGHASVGCLHVRPLMDLRAPGEVARLRRIAEATADLVASHGGSLSGEHGDGRARSELLPRMYDAATIEGFRRLKRLLDPDGLLNPGVIVDPEALDAGLRLSASPPLRPARTAMSFARERGLARAGEACNDNGTCRAAAGGVMCPSYRALRDERHSTRGRAVILRAALEGRLPAGLADDGLHEALELCLSCKACARECPASVDMARLKVEALAHRHRARGVPLRTRIEGHAHELLALGSRAPALARIGAAIGSRFAPITDGPPAHRETGIAPLRSASSLSVGRTLPAPVRRWRPPAPAGSGQQVALMADTFTRFLHPAVGDAAARVLAACGARVEVVDPGCCGRALLSQGLVARARRRALKALDRLAPHALAGRPIVVLEPSCWSMLVDDLPALVPDDPRAGWVAEAAVGFERALLDLGAPALEADRGRRVVVHAHCHARALGAGDEALAAASLVPGVDARPSGAGCCGMAGAFGYRHPVLSRRIGEERLAPAARQAEVVLAPGTSCRAQVEDLTGVRALHPAEYLASRLAPAPA